MNYKPFDLEKAKAGAPIQSSNGSQRKLVCHIPHAAVNQRVVATNMSGDVFLYSEEGRPNPSYYPSLVMAPVEYERWVVVHLYEDGYPMYVSCDLFDSKEEAVAKADRTEGKTVVAKITYNP